MARDTGPVRDMRVHTGRPWTNGEPFPAVDPAIREAWHGFSNDDYDQVSLGTVKSTGSQLELG